MKNLVLFLVFVFSLCGEIICKPELAPSYLPPPTSVFSKCRPDKKCENIACIAIACTFGNDPLACTCCATCLKGPGESCGGPSNKEGRCTENYICVDGSLQEIPSSKHPKTPVGKCRLRFCPDCALLDCVPEERLGCKKGLILDPYCGCCKVCKRGLDEECGGPLSTKGACPKEVLLVCEDEEGKEILPQEEHTPVGTCKYIDGLSLPPGVTETPKPEPCPSCALVLCLKPDCPETGIDPVCGCCPVCVKGPGESCGGADGICRNGSVCQNSKCVQESYETQTDIRPATLLGYAQNIPPSDTYGQEPEPCPDCRVLLCGTEDCTFPTDDPRCVCCPACRKGPGESCGGDGNINGICGDELTCENQQCIESQDKCPNCKQIACGIPKCDYGTEIDPQCGCCPVCLKGPGESCGGENNKDGNCGYGLSCRDSKCIEKRIKPGCLDCELVRVKCVSPDALGCPNNYQTSDCTCCPECLRKKGYQ